MIRPALLALVALLMPMAAKGAVAANWRFDGASNSALIEDGPTSVTLACRERGTVALRINGDRRLRQRQTGDLGLKLGAEGPYLFPASSNRGGLEIRDLPPRIVEKLSRAAGLDFMVALADQRRPGRSVLTAVEQVSTQGLQSAIGRLKRSCGLRQEPTLAAAYGSDLVRRPANDFAGAAPTTSGSEADLAALRPPPRPNPSGEPLIQVAEDPPPVLPRPKPTGQAAGPEPVDPDAFRPPPPRPSRDGTDTGSDPGTGPEGDPAEDDTDAGMPTIATTPGRMAVETLLPAPDLAGGYRWVSGNGRAGILFDGEHKFSGLVLACEDGNRIAVVIDLPGIPLVPVDQDLILDIDDNAHLFTAKVVRQRMENSLDLVFHVGLDHPILTALIRGGTVTVTAGDETARYDLTGSGEVIKALRSACGG